MAVVLAACGGGSGDRAAPAEGEASLTIAAAFPQLSFDRPLFLAAAPGDAEHVYIVTQPGLIHRVRNQAASSSKPLFLDLSAGVRSDGEQGLLGLAFDPEYASNRFFYVYYSPADAPRRTVVARWTADAAGSRALAGSESLLLVIPQPDFGNHKGGSLAFGPDGMLYVAVGDGGGANDPADNAQNRGVLLGKILRLRRDGSVPPDNPFVGLSGARGEIWAYGLRNPFRIAFDRAGGQLWAADVGQAAREEIDRIVAGGNYGWRVYEGTRSNINPDNRPASDFLAPLFEYARSDGNCSITGGYVYRGSALPAFVGRYFFSDFCSGRLWALRVREGDAVERSELGRVPGNPTSFGEDSAGELFVTSFDGNIYRLQP